MPAEAILSVQGLTKRYEGLLALAGIDFDVARGEIFGVIGPNGAGKTTLFSCLVGAVAPTSGNIRFRGDRIDGLPNHAVVTRGLVRTLATEPEILCLDEVMGGLNPSEIMDAMKLIVSIRDSGVTVLMIEHHVHAVVGVSDRILVLNFGQKIAEGSPSAVVKDPGVISAYLGDE